MEGQEVSLDPQGKDLHIPHLARALALHPQVPIQSKRCQSDQLQAAPQTRITRDLQGPKPLAMPHQRRQIAVLTMIFAGLTIGLIAGVGSDPAVARKSQCRSVDARPLPSTVEAINMPCRKARRLVRYTTRHNRRPPRGWIYINPAGCEGIIVRRRDRKWVIAHDYRPRPGRQAVWSVIYRGCRS